VLNGVFGRVASALLVLPLHTDSGNRAILLESRVSLFAARPGSLCGALVKKTPREAVCSAKCTVAALLQLQNFAAADCQPMSVTTHLMERPSSHSVEQRHGSQSVTRGASSRSSSFSVQQPMGEYHEAVHFFNHRSVHDAH
jgi:hypothetical protein